MAPPGDGSSADDGGMRPWEAAALDGLVWNWGEAYEIEAWRARRRDGGAEWIVAPGPDGLRAAIIADYTARPVPR